MIICFIMLCLAIVNNIFFVPLFIIIILPTVVAFVLLMRRLWGIDEEPSASEVKKKPRREMQPLNDYENTMHTWYVDEWVEERK